jgi:uncharacterized protein involved in exopolysaccharide biosynthesis
MDFRRYLDFLRSQWEWIAIATIAGGVIAMSIALSATPKYAATAELFLATPGYSSVASIDTADNSRCVLTTARPQLRRAGDTT